MCHPVLVRLQKIWSKRYAKLRFVSPAYLLSGGAAGIGKPLAPADFQKRVFEQCEDARAVLEKVSADEVKKHSKSHGITATHAAHHFFL